LNVDSDIEAKLYSELFTPLEPALFPTYNTLWGESCRFEACWGYCAGLLSTWR